MQLQGLYVKLHTREVTGWGNTHQNPASSDSQRPTTLKIIRLRFSSPHNVRHQVKIPVHFSSHHPSIKRRSREEQWLKFPASHHTLTRPRFTTPKPGTRHTFRLAVIRGKSHHQKYGSLEFPHNLTLIRLTCFLSCMEGVSIYWKRYLQRRC